MYGALKLGNIYACKAKVIAVLLRNKFIFGASKPKLCPLLKKSINRRPYLKAQLDTEL